MKIIERKIEYIMVETYVLYLCQDMEKPILLGVSNDPLQLYQNALNPQTADKKDKSLILNWLTRVESNLNEQEQRDMDYAFTMNPLTDFSYTIRDLTLYIKQINQY
jgi:hypothetical protein